MVKNVFGLLEGDFQRFNRIRDWFQMCLVFVCAIDPGLRREIKNKCFDADTLLEELPRLSTCLEIFQNSFGSWFLEDSMQSFIKIFLF